MSAEEGRAPSVVRKSVESLAAWYRQNKPDLKRMTLSQHDFDRLTSAAVTTLTKHGFRKTGESFHWNEFELVRRQP